MVFTACGHASTVPPTSAGPSSPGSPVSDRRVVDANTVIDHGRVLHGMLPNGHGRRGSGPSAASVRRTLSGGSNLVYNSGLLHSIPQVAIVYWGFSGSANDPNGEATYLTNFVNGMGGTWWAATLTQYQNPLYIGSYSIANPATYLVGTWYDTTNTVPATPSSGDIAAEAQRAVNHFGFLAPQLVNFVIATPTGHSTSDFVANGGNICAWHSTTTTSPGGATFPFTNFPYQSDAGSSCGENLVNSGSAGTLDGVSIVAGHEIAETVTDPEPYSGWADSSDQEIGDKCAWINLFDLSTSHGTFAVQPLWSNAITDCAQSYQSSAPTKSCTNDSYGYCLQQAVIHTVGSYCGSTGKRASEAITSNYLWNNGVYAGEYERWHWVSNCSDPDDWSPSDPATQNTDPTLP